MAFASQRVTSPHLPARTSGTLLAPWSTLPCHLILQLACSHGRSQEPPFTSWSNVSGSSLQSPTPTDPAALKYEDPDLTGCYVGTGGSTTITLTSGDAYIGSPEIVVGTEPRTLNSSCLDFFGFNWKSVAHVMDSFAASPICASGSRLGFECMSYAEHYFILGIATSCATHSCVTYLQSMDTNSSTSIQSQLYGLNTTP